MTEQPDTAAIRAASRGNTYRYLAGIVMVLCDALDAARAERDALAAIVDMAGEWPKAMARAEAAEAEAEWNKNQALLQEERSEAAEALAAQLQEVADHCHVLEARIAAALNALHGPATDAVRVAAAIDAPTEGTGQ